MFPGQCGNTAFFFKSQPDQFHFEFRGIVFPGKSFFSAHEVSTCKISGCLSYRILDSGPDGTQTTLTILLPKKTGLAPCFCNTNDVLVLMSGRVVTKANLSHVDGGVRCSLVNCSTVATTELFNRHFRIFAVPLIKSSAVTEATLGQID